MNGKQLLRLLRKEGHPVEQTKSGHHKVTGPNGVVILAGTASCARAFKNDRARLRRAGIHV